jgi:hypothetical protein
VALATGALLCLNRRTVCAALRAVDGASDKGFGRFHRFLSPGCKRRRKTPSLKRPGGLVAPERNSGGR